MKISHYEEEALSAVLLQYHEFCCQKVYNIDPDECDFIQSNSV